MEGRFYTIYKLHLINGFLKFCYDNKKISKEDLIESKNVIFKDEDIKHPLSRGRRFALISKELGLLNEIDDNYYLSDMGNEYAKHLSDDDIWIINSEQSRILRNYIFEDPERNGTVFSIFKMAELIYNGINKNEIDLVFKNEVEKTEKWQSEVTKEAFSKFIRNYLFELQIINNEEDLTEIGKSYFKKKKSSDNTISISDSLSQHEIKKLTGPIEHWLTTFNSNYWGLTIKHREKWKEINPGDIFVFHATKPVYIKKLTDLKSGIIGIGVVASKTEKKEAVWLGEINGLGNHWPHLIHFSEIYWFGDVNKIKNKPVSEKSENDILKEVQSLSKNVVTFDEMRVKCNGYAIPAMGSISGIKKQELIIPLIKERVHNLNYEHLKINRDIEDFFDGIGYEYKDDSDVTRKNSTILNFNFDELKSNEDNEAENSMTTHTINRIAIERANIEHSNTLVLLKRYIEKKGLKPYYTTHIDLYIANNDNLLLFEAKSITSRNELKQIRQALGQIFEYEYYDIKKNLMKNELKSISKIFKCLIFNKKPKSIDYLKSLQESNIHTYWVEEEKITGFDVSMDALDRFLSESA